MHINALLFILIVTSLTFLFLFSSINEFEVVNIEKINKSYIGKKVLVEGKIKSIKNSNGNYFLKLYNSDIQIVFFKSTVEKNSEKFLNLKENKIVKIIGKVSEYKGNLEIIGKDIIYD